MGLFFGTAVFTLALVREGLEVLVIGAGFFSGEVIAVVEVLTIEVRLPVVVVVEVAVEGRLVLDTVVELARDDEICLFAVSFICLSIMGDLGAGARAFAAPRVDPLVGAVFGLKI